MCKVLGSFENVVELLLCLKDFYIYIYIYMYVCISHYKTVFLLIIKKKKKTFANY